MSDPVIENPVKDWRIQAARDNDIENASQAAIACRIAGLPFWAACALLEKESSGMNVWGNDKRVNSITGKIIEWGVFSGVKLPVTHQSFLLFEHEVVKHGRLSNGVGPCQITWAGELREDGTRDGGFFTDMQKRGLRPWVVVDNMQYGFEMMVWLHESEGSWEKAGTRYNGNPEYGADFLTKIIEWRELLKIKGPDPK